MHSRACWLEGAAPACGRAMGIFDRDRPALPANMSSLGDTAPATAPTYTSSSRICVSVGTGRRLAIAAPLLARGTNKQDYKGHRIWTSAPELRTRPLPCNAGFSWVQQRRLLWRWSAGTTPHRPAGERHCWVLQDSPPPVCVRNILCETSARRAGPTVEMCESDEQYVPASTDGWNLARRPERHAVRSGTPWYLRTRRCSLRSISPITSVPTVPATPVPGARAGRTYHPAAADVGPTFLTALSGYSFPLAGALWRERLCSHIGYRRYARNAGLRGLAGRLITSGTTGAVTGVFVVWQLGGQRHLERDVQRFPAPCGAPSSTSLTARRRPGYRRPLRSGNTCDDVAPGPVGVEYRWGTRGAGSAWLMGSIPRPQHPRAVADVPVPAAAGRISALLA